MTTEQTFFVSLFLLLYVSPVLPINYCGDGEMETWGDHCYFFSTIIKDWPDAKEICESKGATLASIHSMEEQEYITKHMDPHHKFYYIGLKKNSGDPWIKRSFKWIDGTEVDFDNWSTNPIRIFDCVDTGVADSTWTASECHNYMEFVCKANIVRGWQQYDSNEYYISTLPDEIESTWYEARDRCMQLGGDVASIMSDAEVKQVIYWATKTSYQGQLWIGLNQLDGDRTQWGWSDGSSFSSSWNNWGSEYPNNDKYGYLCGYQTSDDTNGKWKNGHCDTKKGFLCKRPISSNPTPKTTAATPAVDGYCPAGYYGSGNKCFKVFLPGNYGEGSLTFEEALIKCRQEPGRLPDLASIENELDQALIDAHLTAVKLGVWIGLRREAVTSTWIWVDSSPYQYEHWGPSKPDVGDSHCAEVRMVPGYLGEWNNIQCSDKRGYVCQTYKNPDNVIPTSATPKVNFTCPADFSPYWYGCYRYQPTALSYDKASEECRKLDSSATLVGIHAEAENAAVQTLSLTNNNDIWLGFRDRNSTNGENGEYKWEDDWYVFWTNWASGQPVKESQGGCVKMSSDGRWRDDVCDKQYPSVCKISQVSAQTTPKTLPGKCPHGEGWFEYAEHCYYVETEPSSSWEKAKQECQDKGFLSSLASIHSYLENKMIQERLNLMGHTSRNLWIGLYRSNLDRSRMKWTDGSAVQFEAWAPGQPDSEDRNLDCVRMWNEQWSGHWDDHYCTDTMGYVCKAPKAPHITLPTLAPHCDEGWQYSLVTGHCYLFRPDDSRPYRAARSVCHGVAKAHLVSIHDAFDMRGVRTGMNHASVLPSEAAVANYWIGIAFNQTGEDTFESYWTDNSLYDYDNWDSGQPYHPGAYPCVVANKKDGKWSTSLCESQYGYACKLPSRQGTPTDVPTEDVPNGGSGKLVADGHFAVLFMISLLGMVFRLASSP